MTARENKSRHRSACARPTRSNSVAAVLRGRVVIRAPSSEGKEVILNIINEGEIFGEIALLNLDFVTRLERCGQTADAGDPFRNRWFAATRLPSFGAASELGRSILAAGQPRSCRPRHSTSLTSISAVSMPMPTTRASRRNMAWGPRSGASSNRCRRASSICLIWPIGIVNLSGRGMLLVSVARQLGSGNPFARLLCCPAQAEPGRKEAPSVR